MSTDPRIILLIGPSAGGKSLFGEYWRKLFPQYEHADDLHLVLEYLKKENKPRIEDPKVWDDIIVRLARELAPGKHHLVEFARGHDKNYLREFDIGEEGVYPRTLNFFLNSLDKSFENSVAIIHVTSNYKIRLARNNGRRITTGQDLPDKVLEDIFWKDIFHAEYIDKPEQNPRRGRIHTGDRTIPVATINNNENLSPVDMQNRFAIFSEEAMRYFTDKD